jgi:hypothetical protein
MLLAAGRALLWRKPRYQQAMADSRREILGIYSAQIFWP